MPRLIDFAVRDEPWADVPEGKAQVLPLLEKDGVRARLLVTRSGSWPAHVDDHDEAYFVLRGEVVYYTDREIRVRAGQGILFAPGESHSARIEGGAVSLKLEFDPRFGSRSGGKPVR
jgi:mannose-6-phosphate isomerase-like protein (cupin superfamily)